MGPNLLIHSFFEIMLAYTERVSLFDLYMINYKEEKGKFSTLQTIQNTKQIP